MHTLRISGEHVSYFLGVSGEESNWETDLVQCYFQRWKQVRYFGRLESSILKQEKYSFDLVMEALKTIPASDVAYAKLMDCGAKEACIMGTLITWMIGMQRQDSVGIAA